MITRNELLGKAVDDCIKDLYSFAQPTVTWDNFIKENKEYSDKYKAWERFRDLSKNEKLTEEELKEYSSYPSDWKNKSIIECIGPRPYEFYYLPKDIMKDICDTYVNVYRMDSQQELLNTIEILKNYCRQPIVDKYIEGKNGFPGHRGYDHPDNLEKEINTYLDLKFPLMDPERAEDAEDFENKLNTAAKELQSKFFEFLDMAGNFYCWNSELNSFNTSVYLGPSPNSNKQAVIDNWKKYRDTDIEINEEQIKKDYYGEDELD